MGEEYAGTARLHSILADMISFAAATSESDEGNEGADIEYIGPDKPWTLLFDAEACDEEHAAKTLEEMEIPAA